MSLTGPARTAVFIEPTGSLRDLLLERKAWLEARMPGQPYCAHPPHCTLLFGDYGDDAAWSQTLAARLRSLPAFTIATESWHVFADDALAGGGQTVALRVAATLELFALQLAVAEVIGPAQRGDPANHPLANREPFGTSLRRYGFPFVGAHWLPHFTIGSPRVPRDDALVAALQAGPPGHAFTLHSVSLWSVRGEEHHRRRTLPLGA